MSTTKEEYLDGRGFNRDQKAGSHSGTIRVPTVQHSRASNHIHNQGNRRAKPNILTLPIP